MRDELLYFFKNFCEIADIPNLDVEFSKVNRNPPNLVPRELNLNIRRYHLIMYLNSFYTVIDAYFSVACVQTANGFVSELLL